MTCSVWLINQIKFAIKINNYTAAGEIKVVHLSTFSDPQFDIIKNCGPDKYKLSNFHVYKWFGRIGQINEHSLMSSKENIYFERYDANIFNQV